MTLPSTLINELRKMFEDKVCKQLGFVYIQKNSNTGDYSNDFIQNEWIASLENLKEWNKDQPYNIPDLPVIKLQRFDNRESAND